MKKYLLSIAIIGLLLYGMVLAPYFMKFHHVLSDNSADWSNFGSYLSGAAGSIFSFLALIGVLFSISVSNRQFETRQIEAKREDFFRLIDLKYKVLSNLSCSKGSGLNGVMLFNADIQKRKIEIHGSTLKEDYLRLYDNRMKQKGRARVTTTTRLARVRNLLKNIKSDYDLLEEYALFIENLLESQKKHLDFDNADLLRLLKNSMTRHEIELLKWYTPFQTDEQPWINIRKYILPEYNNNDVTYVNTERYFNELISIWNHPKFLFT